MLTQGSFVCKLLALMFFAFSAILFQSGVTQLMSGQLPVNVSLPIFLFGIGIVLSNIDIGD